ncbi:MAG TPA: cupin domain-containing protein, partial [Geminicoccaceae bacterium]|nr:cupin domain-containing protein [Geminicoccaceae bacterium]
HRLGIAMESADAAVFKLSELQQDSPMPQIKRRRIIGEKAMLSEILIEKGCEAPSHHHENEQFLVLLDGRLRMELGVGDSARTVILEAGDVLLLPSNVPHGGVALENSRILDIFSPPSAMTGIDQR